MSAPLDVQSFTFAGRSKGFCTEQRKWVKRVGFAAFAKPDGRHGMFEEDLTR